MSEQAVRDWHRRAIVRFKEDVTCRSFAGEHTYQQGQELEMVQWGRANRSVDRDAWWSSFDIDEAFIVDADKVEVVRIIDEVSPVAESLASGKVKGRGRSLKCTTLAAQASESSLAPNHSPHKNLVNFPLLRLRFRHYRKPQIIRYNSLSSNSSIP